MRDIGNLLENMDTEEGRAKVVKELVTKYQIPENYIINAIGFFEKEGKEYTHILGDAAELAKKSGMIKKSKKLYNEAIKREEREGHLNYAARIAKEAGMLERAKELFTRDSKEKERKKEFYWAAKSAEEAGMTELSRELFKKVVKNYRVDMTNYDHFNDEGILEIIEEITKKAGMENQKQKLYEQTIESHKKKWDTIPGAGFRDAAEFAKKAGMPERAKELTLMAIEGYSERNYYRAIKLAEKIGGVRTLEKKVKEQILVAMEKDRGGEEVAKLAEKMGLPKRAEELYNKAMLRDEKEGRFRDAAKSAEKAGMPEKAKNYKELRKLVGADYLF